MLIKRKNKFKNCCSNFICFLRSKSTEKSTLSFKLYLSFLHSLTFFYNSRIYWRFLIFLTNYRKRSLNRVANRKRTRLDYALIQVWVSLTRACSWKRHGVLTRFFALNYASGGLNFDVTLYIILSHSFSLLLISFNLRHNNDFLTVSWYVNLSFFFFFQFAFL